MPHRFAFVIDPIERFLPDKDTTFVFMLESQARGHEIYVLGIDDLFARESAAYGRVRRVEVMRPRPAEPLHYRLFEERVTPLTWFDAVFMRKDPPFDMAVLRRHAPARISSTRSGPSSSTIRAACARRTRSSTRCTSRR